MALADVFAEYGPRVGGHRYKKFRPPEPLSITILKLVGVGAVFTAASILSPALLANLVYKYLGYKIKKYEQRQIQRSVYYLKRKNFVAFPADKKQKPLLTKLGLKRMKQESFNSIAIKPMAWDGLWRLLTFDIPEEEGSKRYVFRKKLKELGFFHFQRSVFLIPYPCADEIGKAAQFLDIEPYVHLLTVMRFPKDTELLKKFNLVPQKP